MISTDVRKTGWSLRSLLLIGFVGSATAIWSHPSYAEEDFLSTLLPTEESEEPMVEEDDNPPPFFSSTQPLEESIKRPSFLTEQPRPRLVNPQQLIYERAARAARAREARIAAKKWYGISSSRPSESSHRLFSASFLSFPYGYPAYYPGFVAYGVKNPFGL